MNNPKVNIIMNCYNGEKYLKEAIDSIYIQSYPNWEIVFWDNASTDNSPIIAKCYDKKLRYFLAKKHSTLGVARNLALKEARGDYVAFLDCDDLFLPDKIKIQYSEMQENNAVLSYGGWTKIDEKGEELSVHKIAKKFGNQFESLLSKYIVNSQTIMIDNNFLIHNNMNFDEKLSFSTDHNLVLRIALHSPLLAIDKILAKYRVHDNSMSSTKKIDKINDFNYTINFFKEQGIQDKYINFELIALKAKYSLLLLDSIDEKKYWSLPKLFLQYSIYSVKHFLTIIKKY